MNSIKIRGRTTFRLKAYLEGFNSEEQIKYRRGEDTVTVGIPMLGEYKIPMGIEACVDGQWVEHPSVFKVGDDLVYFRFDDLGDKIISEQLSADFTFFADPLIMFAKAAKIYGEIIKD